MLTYGFGRTITRVFVPYILQTDLYGRGYSDAPQTTYDTALYVTQLALLMQYVGWDKAGIVGVSMVRVFNSTIPHTPSDR